MKKNRISAMALLAILFAVGSAFTAKVSAENKSAKQTTPYYWFKVSTGLYQRNTTQSLEQPMSGCSGTGNDCERGYEQGQLNNPSDPSQGVQSSQVIHPKATIVKS